MLEPSGHTTNQTPNINTSSRKEPDLATPKQSVSASALELLSTLPQRQSLSGQVVWAKRLQAQNKALLQQSNPDLIQQLIRNIANSGKFQHTPPLHHNQPAPLSQIASNKILANVELFLVKLKINGQMLTTVTPQPLQPGTSIRLSLHQNNLQIEQLPQQTAVSSYIKQVLPKQEPISHLQQWLQQFQRLPQTTQDQLLGKDLLKTLDLVKNHVHNQQNLASAEQVKRALQSLMTTTEAKWSHQHNISDDLPSLIDKAIKQLSQEPSKTLINGPLAQEASQPLTALLKPATKPISDLANILRLLGVTIVSKQSPAESLPLLVQQQLQKRLEQSYARLQLNHLRALNQNDTTRDQGRPLLVQSFHTEISLRFNEQVLPLQLTIEERERQPDQEQCSSDDNRQSSPTKARCWQVFMSFDLPGNEKLHTQLQLVGKEISATLWAESQSLCSRTKAQVDMLKNQLATGGLIVSEIHCHYGKPTQSNVSLGYNLVDITT